MRVTFIISGPSGEQRLWLSTGQTITVGRTEQADFVCPRDARMSSKHLRLECHDKTCGVRDLNSTNGTYVNGERIEETTLNHDDRVLAGSTEFRAVMENASTQPPAPSKKPTVQDIEPRAAPKSAQSVSRAEPREPSVTSPRPAAPKTFSAPNPPAANQARSTVRDTASLTRLASTGSRLQVIVGYGGHDERRIWLRQEQKLVVGRSESADVAVRNDPQLHDRHFQIAFADGAWQMKTFGDATCTAQNGRQVPTSGLTDGDVIVAGNTTFLIQIEGSAHAQSVESPTCHTTNAPSGIVQATPIVGESAMNFFQIVRRLTETHAELVCGYVIRPGAAAIKELLAPAFLYDWLPEWFARTRSPVIVTEFAETTELAGALDSGDVIACAFVERDRQGDAWRRLRAAARGQDRLHGTAQAEYLFSTVPYEHLPELLANSSPKYARFLFDGIAGLVFPRAHGQAWIALGPNAFVARVVKLSAR